MSSPEAIGAAARDAAQVYGAEQYAAGAVSRQGEIDELKAQETADVVTIATLRATYTTLQAAFDAYKLTHPDIPPPPPPPPVPLIGMNLEPKSSAVAAGNAPYEKLADVARIYITPGQTDIRKEDQFVRAADLGIRAIVPSWKDTTTTAPAKCMDTIPPEFKWWGIKNHEPEDDIADHVADPTKGFSLAQWHAWQDAFLPLIAAKGGIPSVCFMSYTVNPVSKRNILDYKRPAGQVRLAYWDYYPNKEPKPTQATTVDRIKAATKALGIPGYGIGEYGILHGSTVYTAATVTEFHGLTPDAVVKCYWSNRQKEDQTFTEQTASAWFA